MKWISVKDRLPIQYLANAGEYFTEIVLAVDNLSRQWVVEYCVEGPNKSWEKGRQYWSIVNDNDNYCHCINCDFDEIPITHWMPLPELPKE